VPEVALAANRRFQALALASAASASGLLPQLRNRAWALQIPHFLFKRALEVRRALRNSPSVFPASVPNPAALRAIPPDHQKHDNHVGYAEHR